MRPSQHKEAAAAEPRVQDQLGLQNETPTQNNQMIFKKRKGAQGGPLDTSAEDIDKWPVFPKVLRELPNACLDTQALLSMVACACHLSSPDTKGSRWRVPG